MFQALERVQRRLYPGAAILPIMSSGASDKAQLRAKGVQAYGFGPVSEEDEGNSGGAHGDDERIAETSLLRLVEFLWYAALDVAASR
jgi:acetylornithine deacetylase/succinyl-diaminopimelate desuccinylase-like protein